MLWHVKNMNSNHVYMILLRISAFNSLIDYFGFIGRLTVQFVALTQPINALAFVFDGLHYGVSDFEYAAVLMVNTSKHLRSFHSDRKLMIPHRASI